MVSPQRESDLQGTLLSIEFLGTGIIIRGFTGMYVVAGLLTVPRLRPKVSLPRGRPAVEPVARSGDRPQPCTHNRCRGWHTEGACYSWSLEVHGQVVRHDGTVFVVVDLLEVKVAGKRLAGQDPDFAVQLALLSSHAMVADQFQNRQEHA